MKKTALLLPVALLLTSLPCAAQGPLTPSDAPGETMKTLGQIEPRTPISSASCMIAQSGSYYLTTNLTVGTEQNGITVNADDVTIHLNGLTLTLTGSGAVSGYGIYSGAGSTISGCSVSYNTGAGIVGTGSTISGCAVFANTGDGIQVSCDSKTTGNTCDSNGSGGDGAGIHVDGSSNRIDSNSVTDNDRGIDVDDTGNLIIRNSASGNATNYVIVGGNKDAQVLSPGSGFVSTDPWANFSF